MKSVFSLLFFATLLFASNPKIFSALGDTIYDNAHKIEKLKKFKEYQPYKKKIESYIKDVNATKKMGFGVESKQSDNQSVRNYLKKLRELAKRNDFYVRSANSVFKKALVAKKYEVLMDILDTGLIDIKRYKEALVEFYEINKSNFTLRGTLKKIIQEENVRKKIKTQEDLKKEHEHKLINDLRERDKQEQEKLQKKLEMELSDKSTSL